MSAIRAANLGVRFALELASLGAVAVWGYQTTSSAARWPAAGAAPLALALVWGALVSPKARVRLPVAARVAVEAAWFGVAALALAAIAQPLVAAIFLAVALSSSLVNAR